MTSQSAPCPQTEHLNRLRAEEPTFIILAAQIECGDVPGVVAEQTPAALGHCARYCLTLGARDCTKLAQSEHHRNRLPLWQITP